MRILKLRIAVVGFLGILSLVMAAQRISPQLSTQNIASVSAGESMRLITGQTFSFQIRFNQAPVGHNGGKIYYRFKNVHPAPRLNPNPMEPEGLPEVGGQTELQDGQAIYSLKLPITDLMAPGIWKLASVTLGKSVQTPVSIPDNITFEIPQFPPVVIHSQAPGSVRAGERYDFKITLEDYPERITQGCTLWLRTNLYPVSQSLPSTLAVKLDPIKLNPDQHSYETSGLFDFDTPGGPWQGEVSMYEDRSAPDSQTSKSQFPSSLPPGFEGFCRPLVLNGDVLFHFNVEPALGLVTPTSVTVTVNPSQVELLRGEADRLRAKAEHLKQQLDSGNIAANLVLLRSSLQEAMTDLDKTEANYKERGVDSSSTRAVNVFFDEIRLHYDAARNVLDNNSILAPQTRPRLERVSTALGESTPRLNSASKAVVDSISHNAMAYLVAASSGTMVLNLDVFSEPKGATVSYRQRTETEFRVLDHKTDCQIPNLYRAGYLIRFQKQGYKEQVVSFNGQDSTTTSISVDLAPEGRP